MNDTIIRRVGVECLGPTHIPTQFSWIPDWRFSWNMVDQSLIIKGEIVIIVGLDFEKLDLIFGRSGRND